MYGILMEKEIDQEVMDMCNFRDFIEQRGIEQGLLQGKAEGNVEGKVEATFLHVKNWYKNQCQCNGRYEYTGC